MADPIVTISGGLPNSGTGTITTLGITIPPAASLTSGVQGGPMVQGAVTSVLASYTNGQIDPLSLTTTGLLRVDGSNVTQPVSGTITATISGTPTVIQGSPPWSMKPDGTTWAMTTTSANVNVTNTVPVSGTVTANQGGTWTVQPGNTANTTAWLVTGTGGTFPVTGTVSVSGSAVSIAGNASVQGDTPSGSADANNPIKIGGVARTSNPTAVTNGQRVNGIFDKLGKQVVVGAIRDVKGRTKTSITTNTATSVIAAGGVGVFNDVYAIVVTNKSATSVTVDFNDGAAVVMTIAAPAGDTRGFTVAVDSAMVQSGANAAWTATVSAAVTSIEITMLYVSNL